MRKKLIIIWVCFFAATCPELSAQLKKVIPKNAPFRVIRPSSPTPSNPTSCTADTIILTTQAQIDNFSTDYPACTTPKYLFIDGNGANPAITSLSGLGSLTQIINKLIISNTSVTNLSALTNLTQIGDTLQLDHNALLTSIGLNNLTQLGGIILIDLPVLTSIAGLSNNIDSTGSVNIDSTALTNLDGLSGIVDITNGGGGYGLRIANTPIVNLNSLVNLSTIEGYLILENNAAMTSIGLNSLTQVYGFLFSNLPNLTSMAGISYQLTNTNIGTFWMINTGLSNLSGLDSLTGSSNFYIFSNPNLTALTGLENLTGNIGAGISLLNNNLLTNISALSNITSINAGTLDIRSNNSLADLAGLDNIITIGGGLWLIDNPVINSLNFLDSTLVIQNNNLDSVRIIGNNQLALCAAPPLCNYLNGSGGAIILNNAPGCNSIPEILASCNECTGGVLKTWTGAIGTDWDDADNWSPAGVPGICDTVYIATGLPDYPVVNSSITIHGLIMESGTSLDLDDYSLLNHGTINIIEATITSTLFSNSIVFRNATDPYIENASLLATNITIEGYSGQLQLIGNTLYDNVVINDSINRDGPNTISGNNINGNLTITTNSPAANAETFISTSDADQVLGHVIFNINAPVLFRAGDGNSLGIGRDLTLTTNVDPQFIELNQVSFVQGSESHIRQLGSTPITIQNLFPEKSSPQSYIIPEQDIFIGNDVSFSNGIIKTTSASLLVFKDDAGVSQTSSGSWVWGPVKKIGNDPFQFPLGDSLRKAVFSISAPLSATDAFTAQYFHINPTSAGYDTSQHVASLTRISGKEYWMLNRDSGNSAVQVTLHYDSTRSNTVASLYSLRASRWSGSQWLNAGVSSFTGNLHEAFITSFDTLSAFGPVTLGYVLPPIIPVITVGNMDSIVCRNVAFKVRFNLDTLMYSNNTFFAQLSDSTGNFSSPLNIGFKSSINSDSINAIIPVNHPLSNGYRVRVIGTSPPDTSINSKPLAVRTVPLLNFTIQGPDPGCISTGIHTYYASQKEPGVTYNWSLSGGGTLTANQDTAFVTWTTTGARTITLNTSNQCGNGPSANRQITGEPAGTHNSSSS